MLRQSEKGGSEEHFFPNLVGCVEDFSSLGPEVQPVNSYERHRRPCSFKIRCTAKVILLAQDNEDVSVPLTSRDFQQLAFGWKIKDSSLVCHDQAMIPSLIDAPNALSACSLEYEVAKQGSALRNFFFLKFWSWTTFNRRV